MLVEEIMRMVVYTIKPDDTCEHAAAFMAGKDIGSLIIVDHENGVLGLVTERDMSRRIVAKGKPLNTAVKEIMTKDVFVIGPKFTVEEAADAMIRHHVKKLPVVENDKMVGIITATDLIAHEEKLVETLAQAFLKGKDVWSEDAQERRTEGILPN